VALSPFAQSPRQIELIAATPVARIVIIVTWRQWLPCLALPQKAVTSTLHSKNSKISRRFLLEHTAAYLAKTRDSNEALAQERDVRRVMAPHHGSGAASPPPPSPAYPCVFALIRVCNVAEAA
jgi:hypothetical protein